MTTAGVDQRLRPVWRQALNVGGYLLVITVNTLANALPINGITSGAVSDMFPIWVTPAGYVFSFWGLIYAPPVTLIVCYERLRGPDTSRTEWFAVRLPFSVCDVPFALVAIWALVGIAVAQGGRSGVIAVTATSLAALLAGAIGIQVALARRHST